MLETRARRRSRWRRTPADTEIGIFYHLYTYRGTPERCPPRGTRATTDSCAAVRRLRLLHVNLHSYRGTSPEDHLSRKCWRRGHGGAPARGGRLRTRQFIRSCVKSLRSSYMGLYPQRSGLVFQARKLMCHATPIPPGPQALEMQARRRRFRWRRSIDLRDLSYLWALAGKQHGFTRLTLRLYHRAHKGINPTGILI